MKNSRFWIFVNGGHVKLTLAPGQSLSWSRFERHDEGWTMDSNTWALSRDGLALTSESTSDGTDCDGRITRHFDSIASADPFDFVEMWDFDGKRPDWQELDAWQRDQFAEAAGY